MIAVDTNILVYSHRTEVIWHTKATMSIRTIAESGSRWAIPWPCIHEFLAVVTNRKIHERPTPMTLAFSQIRQWLSSPDVVLLNEGAHHLDELETIAVDANMSGGKIHDARIAAICLQHGVTELWTADRDFTRFPKLKTRNPLVS